MPMLEIQFARTSLLSAHRHHRRLLSQQIKRNGTPVSIRSIAEHWKYATIYEHRYQPRINLIFFWDYFTLFVWMVLAIGGMSIMLIMPLLLETIGDAWGFWIPFALGLLFVSSLGLQRVFNRLTNPRDAVDEAKHRAIKSRRQSRPQ